MNGRCTQLQLSYGLECDQNKRKPVSTRRAIGLAHVCAGYAKRIPDSVRAGRFELDSSLFVKVDPEVIEICVRENLLQFTGGTAFMPNRE